MIRRRGEGPLEEEESSSDDDDAFSALSKKVDVRSFVTNTCTIKPEFIPKVALLPVSKTSSMKRHHKPDDARKASMDALIQELEAENSNQKPKKMNRFVPEKKGSFVQPDEEHLTTNLFIGNLAPSITEEDLSNLFSQFGVLYSVKIMWPRTTEERNRRRNTGFVCFMNRDDAEEALEACDETDTFNNGRLLMLRWGKSVKKERRETDDPQKLMVKNPDEFLTPSRSPPQEKVLDLTFQAKPYDPKIHADKEIRVEIPKDQSRYHFISITASYVAKDPELETRLKDEEKGNPTFSFLAFDGFDGENLKEKTFYRWRVYSFCQGDTYSIWRTQPFVMFSHENARYWIPPTMDMDAVNKEKANAREKEIRLRQQKVDRANRELMTGRQFEREIRKKRRGEYGSESKLNPDELSQFDQLVRRDLSISRERICQAMAFCFDHCNAAQDVTSLLKQALLEESDNVTNEMRIARMYLLSDVLFNSQQPGVRNAFMYRSSIELDAPDIFHQFGSVLRIQERKSGRITVNKIRRAVSSVFSAWTEWGVFDASFVDELETHFDGREIKVDTSNEKSESTKDSKEQYEDMEEEEEEVVIHEARGDWKKVSTEVERSGNKKKKKSCSGR